MSREAHVRFCESVAVKFCCATRPPTTSFFHILKTELIGQHVFKTREEAKQTIFEYIEVFYNRQRKHSSINYMTPEQYGKEFHLSASKTVQKMVATSIDQGDKVVPTAILEQIKALLLSLTIQAER